MVYYSSIGSGLSQLTRVAALSVYDALDPGEANVIGEAFHEKEGWQSR